MGLSRQAYWSRLLCPPPGGLPDPGIEPEVLTFPVLADGFFTTSATWEAPLSRYQTSRPDTEERPTQVQYPCCSDEGTGAQK